MKEMKSPLWSSLGELAQVVMGDYTVTVPNRTVYLNQVKQYELYLTWLDKIIDLVHTMGEIYVYEPGPGPGLLAERLISCPNVITYTAVEPGDGWIQMTKDVVGTRGTVLKGVAEKFVRNDAFDLVIATASYHHFHDKPRALRNIFKSLKSGGVLVIADGFLPEYKWGMSRWWWTLLRAIFWWLKDGSYAPVDRNEFAQSVFQYTAAQILAMPNPDTAQIVDQIKTGILDLVRIEELKVCVSILNDQLVRAGFFDINVEHMVGKNPKVNYDHLGYYFVTAMRP